MRSRKIVSGIFWWWWTFFFRIKGEEFWEEEEMYFFRSFVFFRKGSNMFIRVRR